MHSTHNSFVPGVFRETVFHYNQYLKITSETKPHVRAPKCGSRSRIPSNFIPLHGKTVIKIICIVKVQNRNVNYVFGRMFAKNHTVLANGLNIVWVLPPKPQRTTTNTLDAYK
jgi:hypothetical protein